MALHPLLHLPGGVHRVAVYNKIDLLLSGTDQPAQEVDEHLPAEVFLQHPEPDGALVGQRGDNVAPKALPSPLTTGVFRFLLQVRPA
jgi:hypothetical protein